MRRVRRLALGLAALVLLVVADYYGYFRWSGVGGRSSNTGENGLWLRYTWYFGEKSDAEARQLARDLTRRQIRYAYFHVRSITRDGILKFRCPERARRLVEILHGEAPSVEAIAWIYAGNRRGQGEVELANPEVRSKMVSEAVWLVDECGFDGVQWDYEVCEDGDADFLSLMRETRAALPEGKLLGAAVPVWTPAPFPRVGWGWSEDTFARLAGTCDQIAVMCYDTGQYLPRAYVSLVRQQAVHVTRAVARGDRRCRVLLGVPTYERGGISHHAHAEALRMALKGVREGMSAPGADPSVFAGAALFADYTTDGAEWETWSETWLGD